MQISKIQVHQKSEKGLKVHIMYHCKARVTIFKLGTAIFRRCMDSVKTTHNHHSSGGTANKTSLRIAISLAIRVSPTSSQWLYAPLFKCHRMFVTARKISAGSTIPRKPSTSGQHGRGIPIHSHQRGFHGREVRGVVSESKVGFRNGNTEKLGFLNRLVRQGTARQI